MPLSLHVGAAAQSPGVVRAKLLLAAIIVGVCVSSCRSSVCLRVVRLRFESNSLILSEWVAPSCFSGLAHCQGRRCAFFLGSLRKACDDFRRVLFEGSM